MKKKYLYENNTFKPEHIVYDNKGKPVCTNISIEDQIRILNRKEEHLIPHHMYTIRVLRALLLMDFGRFKGVEATKKRSDTLRKVARQKEDNKKK
jgi:hypothetical protein